MPEAQGAPVLCVNDAILSKSSVTGWHHFRSILHFSMQRFEEVVSSNLADQPDAPGMFDGLRTVFEKTACSAAVLQFCEHGFDLFAVLAMDIPDVHCMDPAGKIADDRFVNNRILLRTVAEQHEFLFGKSFQHANDPREFCTMSTLTAFQKIGKMFHGIEQ